MSCYINSNDNRFYVAKESVYGQAAAVQAANRFPAVRLKAEQSVVRTVRRDKTGGRTFQGLPFGVRKQTSFDLTTYLTQWTDMSVEPGYGPLFEASLGRAVKIFAGGQLAGAPTATRLQFTGSHGLESGQGLTFGGEMRFVTALVSSSTVEINAPFTMTPTAGSPIGPTATYFLAGDLGSTTIYDAWSPEDTVQRLLAGAAVDTMTAKVNGDFHEFRFTGPAKDLIDSASFETGQGGLTQFPSEPAITELNYAVIPGHLGQAWLGSAPDRFFTLTEATVELSNAIDVRAREFGSDGPRCLLAGKRSVSLDMRLFSQDDAATKTLYQAARQRSPLAVMFQLGEQPGQLFGTYMKSVILEVPEFDDSEPRLEWHFRNCRAVGTQDDELVVAFG